MKINRKSGKKNIRVGVFALAAAFLALFFLVDASTRPIVENMIEYQAKVFATRLINETMEKQMARSGDEYGSIVKITRGGNGEITSIEADMAQINRLKSRLGSTIVQELESEKSRELEVPVGSIMGNQFTSGRGPGVTIRILPTGYVQTEINNRFSSAGINQTLHQIMLKVSVQMVAILPGYRVKTETVTNYCIAETVIVGKIPQGYASIDTGVTTYAPIEK